MLRVLCTMPIFFLVFTIFCCHFLWKITWIPFWTTCTISISLWFFLDFSIILLLFIVKKTAGFYFGPTVTIATNTWSEASAGCEEHNSWSWTFKFIRELQRQRSWRLNQVLDARNSWSWTARYNLYAVTLGLIH